MCSGVRTDSDMIPSGLGASPSHPIPVGLHADIGADTFDGLAELEAAEPIAALDVGKTFDYRADRTKDFRPRRSPPKP